GLGINATTNTGTLYRLDPQTGAGTIIGVSGGIFFLDSGGVAKIDLPGPASGYRFDFNPHGDRVPVVTATGLNLRINPSSGLPVGQDVSLNGGSSGATGVAYTNSFGQLFATGATTLYALDAASNMLFIQNLPNAGTLTAGVHLTVDGLFLNF